MVRRPTSQAESRAIGLEFLAVYHDDDALRERIDAQCLEEAESLRHER